MRAALGPLADASTLLLGYAQIVSSLLVALPRVEWPEPFASIARVLGVFSLDLSPLFAVDAIGATVGDAMHVRVRVRAKASPNANPNPNSDSNPNPNPYFNPNPNQVTKPMAALLTEARGGREVFFTAAESTFNQLADKADGTAAKAGGAATESGGAAAEVAAAPLRPLKAITYGDGAPLDAATKAALRDVAGFMEGAQVAVPWQPGDALLCAAHTPPPTTRFALTHHSTLAPTISHKQSGPSIRPS